MWNLTLSVSDGTLTLSSTAGLTGSGDGTGSLSYSGPLSAVDAALEGMTYCRPPGPTSCHAALAAQSTARRRSDAARDHGRRVRGRHDGRQRPRLAPPGDPRFQRRHRRRPIRSTLTSPGRACRRSTRLSPLPAITTRARSTGRLQPGYSGTPLIAFGRRRPGRRPGHHGLERHNPRPGQRQLRDRHRQPLRCLDCPVRSSPARQQRRYGPVPDRHTRRSPPGRGPQPQGLTSQLSLLDSQGRVLVQSEGISLQQPG